MLKKEKKTEEKKETKKETNKKKKVTLTATRNTNLANGKFVKKGEQVEVTAEYAERVKKEKNKSFK